MTHKYRRAPWRKLGAFKAFVFMNTDAGSEEQVIADAKVIGNVKEAYLCYGVYDLILKVETENMEDLKKLLAHEYRTIKNVKSTLSLLLTAENSIEELSAEPPLNNIPIKIE